MKLTVFKPFDGDFIRILIGHPGQQMQYRWRQKLLYCVPISQEVWLRNSRYGEHKGTVEIDVCEVSHSGNFMLPRRGQFVFNHEIVGILYNDNEQELFSRLPYS